MLFSTEPSSPSKQSLRKSGHEGVSVAGPAGLSRADLMYRWNAVPTTICAGDTEMCPLCKTHLRRKQRIRRYKERSKTFTVHESCFYTYYDLIKHKEVA
jgi:hypothetical protein